jgi:hypothetical protein
LADKDSGNGRSIPTMTEKSDIPGAGQEKILSRDNLMDIASEVVRELRAKGINGRFRDPENERLRDAKTRLLIESIKAYGMILRDSDLIELERRIGELEKQKEGLNRS